VETARFVDVVFNSFAIRSNNYVVAHRNGPRCVWHEISSHSAPSYVCVCSAFVLSCVGSGLATGLIPRPKSPTDCPQDYTFQINPEWEEAEGVSRQKKKKKKNYAV
jgi:hypothetical protein